VERLDHVPGIDRPGARPSSVESGGATTPKSWNRGTFRMKLLHKRTLKGIVSRDWKGLQMVSFDRFEV
jgi:hypothetical protein